MQIRDRIREFKRVKASELAPNPANWRTHNDPQRNALKGLLAEVGIADAVIAYERPDGTLMLIDGHLRAETLPDQLIPTLILDVNEAEANKLLLSIDPLSQMAGADAGLLEELADQVQTSSAGVQHMLDELKARVIPELEEPAAMSGEGQTVEDQKQEAAMVTVSAGPYRAEVDREMFDPWLEELRQSVGFEKDKVINEILRRLGLD